MRGVEIDFAAHIGAVARYLCGNPNLQLSSEKELRFGTHGSLAVRLDKGTWYDHEQRIGGGTLDLIRHRLGVSNGAAVEWLKSEMNIRDFPAAQPQGYQAPLGRLMATYVYHDDYGTPLFQVRRYGEGESKTFRQFRYDKGAWIAGTKGVRQVPYHLPEILNSSDDLVLLVEGEKDVDALRSLGFLATCNAGGAGKWRRGFNVFLKGKRVVVIPDNDDAGREHATNIASGLLAETTPLHTSILHLPDLPHKGDASDWIAAGGTRDELLRLIRGATRLQLTQSWLEEQAAIAAAQVAPEPSNIVQADFARPEMNVATAQRVAALIENAEVVEGEAQEPPPQGTSINDFQAYMPSHAYIYTPTRALWPAASVNALLGPVQVLDEHGKPRVSAKGVPVSLPAATWLDRNRAVEQMTWAPGEPEIIDGRLLYEGGWIVKPGTRAFNQYLAPAIIPSDAGAASRWVDHVKYVYPDDYQHIIDVLAHRVQRPHEKINHALVLGGSHGIGKDTILEPIKHAIGPWNFQEVSPGQIMGRFNGFLKSVILRVSEARDLGEVNRYGFYDHTKTLIAAPPDVLRVDEKYAKEHPILNVCLILITTNHKTDGIYLPAEDRRHYVAWSDRLKDDPMFTGDYWRSLYAWYESGGYEAVAAYLHERYLGDFDAKAPPPKTAAFWAIVDANTAPEESEIMDLLDQMQRPKGFTIKALLDQAEGGLYEWLSDRKNRRALPHRLEKCGYVPVRNPDRDTGMWVHGNKRCVIYVQKELPIAEMINIGRDMCSRATG